MIGKLDVEEDVMDDDLPIRKRSYDETVSGKLSDVINLVGEC